MAEVYLARCKTYSEEEVARAVRDCFSHFNLDRRSVWEGKRVLLKPNLLAARPPEHAVTTHPAIVGAVIDHVRSLGAYVAIGDSPGGAVRGIARVLNKTGIARVCESRGVEFVNFEASGWSRISLVDTSYEIARAVSEFDLVINLPKFKTHVLTLITGAVKNTFGCIPGFRKSALHLANPKPDEMASAIVDIFAIVKPFFNLLDAVYAMEGDGPASGRPIHLGIIGASTDAVALDAVFAHLIGLDPERVPTTRIAHERSLGEGSIDAIKIKGSDPAQVRPASFSVPSNWKFRLIPKPIANLVSKLVWVRPRIDPASCTNCHECIKMCPSHAITVEEGVLTIDDRRCVSCLCCHEICEFGAVEIKMSTLARLLA